jgi:predicted permease
VRSTLVVVEVALSFVLVVGAGLMVRSFLALQRVDPGFRAEGVLAFDAALPPGAYPSQDAQAAVREQLREALQAIPGVTSVGLANGLPLGGGGGAAPYGGDAELADGDESDLRQANVRTVAQGYFETLGTPLLAGRNFTFKDHGSSRLAIVNQAMARYYFGDSDPIGKLVTFEGYERPYEIVGVVGDAKYLDLREAPPRTIYLSALQAGSIFSQLALRTTVAPASITDAVRQTVRDVLKTVPVAKVTTMADQVDASIVPERLIAMLSGLFGILGSLLAAIGLYGLLAYTVARRVNEIGIRMALGATPSDEIRMVLRDALGMVCAGLAIGVPIALWANALRPV